MMQFGPIVPRFSSSDAVSAAGSSPVTFSGMGARGPASSDQKRRACMRFASGTGVCSPHDGRPQDQRHARHVDEHIHRVLMVLCVEVNLLAELAHAARYVRRGISVITTQTWQRNGEELDLFFRSGRNYAARHNPTASVATGCPWWRPSLPRQARCPD